MLGTKRIENLPADRFTQYLLVLPHEELTRNLGRNDCLASSGAKCTLDAMNRQARVAHLAHEDLGLVVRDCDRGTNGIVDILQARG